MVGAVRNHGWERPGGNPLPGPGDLAAAPRAPIIPGLSGGAELPTLRRPIAMPGVPAGVAQLVEHHVANVVVVGSNPITRFVPCVGVVSDRQGCLAA
jgi:hypothetical protein